MSDWKQHDGGPQPVADDVWMEVIWPTPEGLYLATCRDEIETADEIPWDGKQRYRILNQHLIDAARLEGIRLGLEAKMRLEPSSHPALRPRLRMPDPATIAREAVLDKLASEAQEQGMGYE